MREFVVRTCLMLDFLISVPVFVLLIWVDPDRYVTSLEQSGHSIGIKLLKYRRGE